MPNMLRQLFSQFSFSVENPQAHLLDVWLIAVRTHSDKDCITHFSIRQAYW